MSVVMWLRCVSWKRVGKKLRWPGRLTDLLSFSFLGRLLVKL